VGSGAWLGVDVGTVRVGVAITDPERTLATPVATVPRTPAAPAEIADLVTERAAVAIFVGLPRSLDGQERSSAVDARAFASAVAELTPVPVRLIDERLTTSSAARQLGEAGRNAKKQRAIIDQAAAVVILEHALNIARVGNIDTVTLRVASKGSHD